MPDRGLLHRVRVRARAIFRPARVEQDLHDELHSHLGHHIDELISEGMAPEAARAEAMRAFSGLAQAEEACRDARGVRVFAELAQDLRYAVRVLAGRPSRPR